MRVWKNPIITAVAGLLVGFFIGWVLGQGQGVPPGPTGATFSDPHAGIAGAPSLSGAPPQPPQGGRTNATANPRLMEQARELESLLAKDPNNYDHLVQIGNVEYDMGDYFKASDYYEKARTLRDDSPDLLTDLGVCYKETGKPQQALDLFDHAAAMNPNHWQSRYNAAVVRLFDLNDPAGAKIELDKLKTIKVSDPEVAKNLVGLEQEIAKRSK